jgi:hypothetical protein
MMNPRSALYEKVETFQNMLISYATGDTTLDENEFKRLREELLKEPSIKDRLPRFVRTHRDFKQFWGMIKKQSDNYRGRREYLWEEFRPVLEFLENAGSPADEIVTEILSQFDVDNVHRVWAKALERRSEDPGGAITSARTLLETVCKHILDESKISYDDNADLPKLYRLTAEALNLAPNQQSEQIFRQIFGGCQAVIEGIGSLRNRFSDAHGKGRGLQPLESRYAELAVNLAGAMATFLIENWTAKNNDNPLDSL